MLTIKHHLIPALGLSEEFCVGNVLGGCTNGVVQPPSTVMPMLLPSCLSDPYSPIHQGQGCVSGIGNAVMPANAPKTKKIMYDLLDNEEFDREEIPTYEDVARLFPRPGIFRPIVMIGPPGVGRNELKRRLMAMEPERCKATIPRKIPHCLKITKKNLQFSMQLSDTSRPSRPGEIHSKDYFFDSREQMEVDIAAGKFIEHGEYRGNLYGTSVDGIRDFVLAGFQPVISPHYQVISIF